MCSEQLAEEKKKIAELQMGLPEEGTPFLVVGPKGAIQSETKNKEKAASLIEQVEQSKVFPAIAKLLMVLQHALPMDIQDSYILFK